MPISEDEWNKGEVNFFSRLEPVVMKIFATTTDAYTIEEILYSLGRTNNDLPDELREDLGILASDAQWNEQGEKRQMSILARLLEKLVADKKLESKQISEGVDSPMKYYKAKQN